MLRLLSINYILSSLQVIFMHFHKYESLKVRSLVPSVWDYVDFRVLTATSFNVAEVVSDKELPKTWKRIVMLDACRSVGIDKCCINAFHESRACPES